MARTIATITVNSTDHASLAIGSAGCGMNIADTSLNPVAVTQIGDKGIRTEGYVRLGDWTTGGAGRYIATVEPHPLRCETCVSGCECEPGSDGCGHHGCWQAADDLRDTCPGVAAVKPLVTA